MSTQPPDRLPEKIPLEALIFEDNADDIELALRTLHSAGFNVRADIAATRAAFVEFIRSRRYDVVLSDYRMPCATGMEIYEAMKAVGADIPFILVTGSLGDEKAVECVKHGMADYVLKDRLVRLPMAIHRAIDDRRLRNEREMAQVALRRSEAGYRSLVERSPYGIFRARLEDGRFLEVNRALVEMLGYDSEADLLKLDPATAVYVNRSAAIKELQEHAFQGAAWSAEFEWRCKEGATITVELSGRSAQQDELGPYLELIANDISARKLAEKRIRQLNRLYSVTTHVSQAIVRVRNAAELLKEICRIIVEEGNFRMAWVGLTDAETQQVKPIVHWGAEEGYLSRIGVSTADEPAGRGPTGSAARNGARFLCQNTGTDSSFALWREEAMRRGYRSAGAFPLKLKGHAIGAITLYAGEPGYFDDENVALLDELAADVSFALENLELARQRQDAVDELNRFFTLSREMLFISDLFGYIYRRNAAFENNLGFAPGGESYERWTDMIHPEDLQEALRALTKLQSGAAIDSLELRFIAKDSRYKWLIFSATPTPELGAVFAAMHDITDRKNLEEQLRNQNLALEEQNHRVQAANRLKSEFLANMSHELRSPLNGIIGFTELMYDGRIGAMPDPQKDLLGRVLKSSRHLLRLISDVLDVSRIESGKLDLRPERVVLAGLVQEVTGILAALAAEKRIEIDTQVSPGIDEVITDPARFKQVLYNYLSNALKFTGEDGRLWVRVQPEGAGDFRLEVSDTGPGIPAADVGRLFTDFQQLDSGHSKRYQGTGLGLALTKRLVEAQGGSVGVTSEPGKGSTFYAILPRTARSDQGASPCILVIEDEPVQLAVVTHILQKAGFTVESATTGGVAVAKAGTRRFDAMTLDLLLPDVSGWDLLGAIRATEKNRETPVIVLSIVEEGELQPGSFDVQGFITKPVCRDALLGALERVGVTAAGAELAIA